MRIRSFGLERYGAFDGGRQVTFGPGLTVVVGDNETGKSTTLAGLADLLWGFRHGRQDFTFAVGALSLTARLELSDGRQVQIRRRHTGLSTIPDGQPFIPVWGPADPGAHERWRRAFGLSQRELRDGGSRVFQGTGDLAELVFAARSGRAVHALVETLQAESEALFKQHRGNKRAEVRLAWAEFERLRGDAESSMGRARAVREAQEAQERQQRATRTAVTRLDAANEAYTLAERRRRALPEVHALIRLRAEHGRLLAGGPVLPVEQLDAFDAACEEFAAAERDAERLDAELEVRTEDRAALRIDEPLLADAAAINQLERLVEAQARDADQAAKDDQQAEELADKAARLLEDLTGPGDKRSTEELLTALHVPVATAAGLDTLSSDIGALSVRLEQSDDAVHAAEARQRAAASVALQHDPMLIGLLGSVVETIRKEGSAAQLLRAAVDSAANAEGERRDALRQAGAHSVEGAPPAVPSRDAVRQARQLLTDANDTCARTEEEHLAAEQALERARQQLAATDRQHLPDPGMLTKARAHRSDLWGRLVDAAASGLTPGRAEELLPCLAAATLRADEIADDLIGHASAAAKRAQRQREFSEADLRWREATAAAAIAHAAQAEAQLSWVAFWRDLGLEPPAVDSAEDTRRALDDAQKAHTALLAAERRIEALTKQTDDQRGTLAEALARLGHPYPDADLETALLAAEQILTDDDAAREARASAATRATAVEEALLTRARAAGDLHEAQQQWATALRSTSLPSTMTAAGWAVWHTTLSQAREAHHAATQARDQATAARARVDTFTQDVEALAHRHDEDRHDEDRHDGPTAAAVLDRLVTRLRDARDARASASTLGRAITELNDQLTAARTRHSQATAALERLRTAAGLPPDQPVAEILERSRAVLGKYTEAAATEAVIQAAAPGHDLEALVTELADRDAAALDQDLADARDHRDACATAHVEASEGLGAINDRLNQLRQHAGVSDLYARAQEHLALVAERTERYLVASIQYQLLRGQLEAYERRHASPLLDDAGRILERLTGGTCVALRAVDRGDHRYLRVVRADEKERAPGELSEGTADQVYLALRLAAIDQLQRDRAARGDVPLPVVLDDILITFDDRRATATLQVLAKLARNWQIIVFTHHDHLAEIIHSADPPLLGSVHISRLPDVAVPSGVREADEIRASFARWTGDDPATDFAEHPPPSALPGRPAHGRTPPATADYDPGEVRNWARAHGYDVGDRGRIAATVLDAFLHAHSC